MEMLSGVQKHVNCFDQGIKCFLLAHILNMAGVKE